jgi:hypothetical protein
VDLLTADTLLRQVIAFSTPPAKLEELRNLFVKMDTDDSGAISAKYKISISIR